MAFWKPSAGSWGIPNDPSVPFGPEKGIPMKCAIIIPSIGRSMILGETLQRISAQTVPPDKVLAVVTAEADLPQDVPDYVQVVYSGKGLTKQRNVGMALCKNECDYLLFMDDDTFLHPRYVENMVRLFDQHEQIAGLTGTLIKNGDVSIAEADERLREHVLSDDETLIRRRGLYGCNFGVRSSLLAELTFDERLVLYGWLEDADFSYNLSKLGDLYASKTMQCVHLMYPSGGRANHVRFGYSQVMNPYYLCRKNNRSQWDMMKGHWFKGVPANLLGVLTGPERSKRVGRLKGNLIAFKNIISGRIQPEYAEQL
jgi:GT2 family glycosyltransferase